MHLFALTAAITTGVRAEFRATKQALVFIVNSKGYHHFLSAQINVIGLLVVLRQDDNYFDQMACPCTGSS
jgi:hypothetical protein